MFHYFDVSEYILSDEEINIEKLRSSIISQLYGHWEYSKEINLHMKKILNWTKKGYYLLFLMLNEKEYYMNGNEYGHKRKTKC